MTQPTIKEKMEQVIETIAGYVTHFEMNGMKNAEEYIEKSREELRDFAQLICEEMEVELDNAEYDNDYGMGEKDGWNRRESYLRDKAQEILKALE